MPHSPVSISGYVRLIRTNRNFRLLWIAQIVSEIGDWLYSIAIYSLLLKLTDSAQSIAVAVVLQVLPQVLISPAAGVLNDRLSRRRLMIFADLARAVIVLVMLLAVTVGHLWAIYILLFLETMMWGIFEPGRSAIIPSITEGPEILVANALSSTTWSFNLAVGAALGGVAAPSSGGTSSLSSIPLPSWRRPCCCGPFVSKNGTWQTFRPSPSRIWSISVPSWKASATSVATSASSPPSWRRGASA